MTALDEDRKKIDSIDEQIAKLFEERFHVVHDVIDYKMDNNLPILNSGREEEITLKNTALIKDEQIRAYFKKWYENLLALSKDYQKEIRENK